MKKKTTKKATGKKSTAKSSAKKGGAKKATAKKAAPKKAAAKKAAPKKAAAAAAAKKKATPQKAAAPKAASKATPQKAAPSKAAPTAAPKKKTASKKAAPKKSAEPSIEVEDATSSGALKTEILAMAREVYGSDRTDAELLALDPNDIDEMDPSIFYEMVGEKYGVESDPDHDAFGGFGGTLATTIGFVESRWDGSTRKTVETPPTEWLEDYVHPAAGEAVVAAEADTDDADAEESQVS